MKLSDRLDRVEDKLLPAAVEDLTIWVHLVSPGQWDRPVALIKTRQPGVAPVGRRNRRVISGRRACRGSAAAKRLQAIDDHGMTRESEANAPCFVCHA